MWDGIVAVGTLTCNSDADTEFAELGGSSAAHPPTDCCIGAEAAADALSDTYLAAGPMS